MTAQEIFDTVVEHFKKQKVQAYGKLPDGTYNTWDGEEGCLYRGPNNTKCAFGCLIPDFKYNLSMENKTASVLITTSLPDYRPHLDIIMDLQHIHDSPENRYTLLTEYSHQALIECAKTYGLDHSKVDWA